MKIKLNRKQLNVLIILLAAVSFVLTVVLHLELNTVLKIIFGIVYTLVVAAFYMISGRILLDKCVQIFYEDNK